MARRQVPEINAGSMADIAFLLLIFFLAATTMDSDTGLMRQLPAIPDPNVPQDVNKINDRNILEVKVNKDNLLLVEGQLTQFNQLREIAHNFILNPNDEPSMPEREVVNIPYFGNVAVTKAVISLQNDIGTKYGVYLAVQNELIAARAKLRDDVARQEFGIPYEKLDEDRKSAVDDYYKVPISEAEPKRIGE
ncbi:MAG: biopolymer transporter ExbD [Bacteroidales bacterium]|jgi:biopolymer transport protein ExbD|nr:biopolymer transporter ExbD [Bacteroidales bacterium]HNX85183.1 biopolymer transporter ExbD [Bacteroidales bacterium]HPS98878.1 biopolymer transporter ExbD [Bacteroidales bacterium]